MTEDEGVRRINDASQRALDQISRESAPVSRTVLQAVERTMAMIEIMELSGSHSAKTNALVAGYNAARAAEASGQAAEARLNARHHVGEATHSTAGVLFLIEHFHRTSPVFAASLLAAHAQKMAKGDLDQLLLAELGKLTEVASRVPPPNVAS